MYNFTILANKEIINTSNTVVVCRYPFIIQLHVAVLHISINLHVDVV